MTTPKRHRPVLPADLPGPRKPGRKWTGEEFAKRLPKLNRSNVIDYDKQGRRIRP